MHKIKLLAVIEATTVSGPAKNLLGFLRQTRSPEFQRDAQVEVESSIVTFHRTGNAKTAPSSTSLPENDFVAEALAQGIEVDVIAERFAFDPRIIGQLRAIVNRRKPSVLQTHMVKSHFLAKLLQLNREYPWVAYHHGYTTTDLKMQAYNQLNRLSLPSAARVITVCEAFAKNLSDTGVSRDRISVCHNSVEEPKYESLEGRNALRELLGIPEGRQVVLSVGRLSREKGHVDLIESLAALHKLSPSLRPALVIVGDGPERPRIEATAQAKGLTEQLVFAGTTTEVHKYYSIADIVALPSHSEGSPNVLLEAMAAGLPVVANAVGGVPEIAASGETALLVEPGDIEGFAQAMNALLTDVNLAQKLGQAAKAHVRDNFSPSTQARSLVEIYRRVLREASA